MFEGFSFGGWNSTYGFSPSLKISIPNLYYNDNKQQVVEYNTDNLEKALQRLCEIISERALYLNDGIRTPQEIIVEVEPGDFRIEGANTVATVKLINDKL